jgi:hypothetical protein
LSTNLDEATAGVSETEGTDAVGQGLDDDIAAEFGVAEDDLAAAGDLKEEDADGQWEAELQDLLAA